MPELIVTLKGREVSRQPIAKTHTVIGRHVSCDVVIDNPGVSRSHAVIRHQDGRFLISDAGSSNGLFVNGEACLGERVLDDGDTVQVGKFTIIFSGGSGVVEELERNPAPLATAQVHAATGPDRTSQLKPIEIEQFVAEGTSSIEPQAPGGTLAPLAPVVRGVTAAPSDRPSPTLLSVGLLALVAVAFFAAYFVLR